MAANAAAALRTAARLTARRVERHLGGKDKSARRGSAIATPRRAIMEATIGDQICIHGNTVGHEDKTGEIIEVHGMRGEPPYLVRFADGRTRLLFPGPDAVIVPQQRRNQEG
jgi:hypothetical protein